MDNSVIQQILNTQTQMLQHLTVLQQQQSINNMNQTAQQIHSSRAQTGSYGTPLPGQIASPVTPPSPMSVADPTQYGTYAAPYDGGRGPVGTTFHPQNFLRSSLQEMMTFNSSRQSLEASDMYMTQQAQGVQMGMVNAIGGALKGGTTIGSFFIPGLVPSLAAGGAAALAVGGVANAMIGGARTSLDYQNILQQKGPEFISAFHSTNDFGGIGWGLEDRQKVSRFLRGLSQSEFLKDSDMEKILNGAADNNLIKTVTDVQSFQKKFTNIVDAVKQITVTMNQTIDQATEFMGQMQQMGITTKDMPLVAAQSKVLASTLGVSATQGAQLVLNGAQAISQGTGMNTAAAAQNTAENMYYAQNLWNNLPDNSELKNLINNNGGPASVGTNFDQSIRGYIGSQQGNQYLAGLFGSAASIDASGEVSIDTAKLKGLLNSDLNVTQLQQQSMGYINSLNPGQRVEIVGKIGEQLNNLSANDSSLLPGFAKKIAEVYQQQAARAGTPIDMQTALVQSGLAPNYNSAQMMEAMINQATDPQLKASFDARSMKEAQDSHALANSPSIWQQALYWGKKNFVMPFANAGQDASDQTGQMMQSYQKMITGMSDRSTVNAQNLQPFTMEGLDQTFNKSSEIQQNSQAMSGYLMQRANSLSDNFNLFSAHGKSASAMTIKGAEGDITHLQQLMKQSDQQGKGAPKVTDGALEADWAAANNGTLSASEVGSLKKQYDNMGFMQKTRALMVEQKASGQYDGLLGKANYLLDNAGYQALRFGNWLFQSDQNLINLKGPPTTEDSGNAGNTYKALQEQQKQLTDESKKLNQDTAALFSSNSKDITNLSEADLKNLQEKIANGDVSGVKSITHNAQAASLAERAASLKSLNGKYSKGMSDYTQVTQYSQALATSGQLIGDTMNAAGIDPGVINDLMSSIKNSGKDLTKSIKKGNISTSGMYSADKDILKQYDSLFSTMPDYDKAMLANYLESHYSDAKGKITNSDGSVNSGNLEKYLLDKVNSENKAEPNASNKNKKASSGDVSKAAKDHTDAMYQFLTAFQQETGMLNQATSGQPITYSTSLGTRG